MNMAMPAAMAPRALRVAGPRLVAIASGKGGVGKTWLSITLAQILAQRGQRVLLVDVDLGLANIDIQLGLTPKFDLASFLAGRRTLREVVVRHVPADLDDAAFDVLPGRSGAAAMATLDIALLDRLLRELRTLDEYDLVLLDLGAGIDPSMRLAAAAADTALVVCTDEPTAVADAYAVLKLRSRDLQQHPSDHETDDVRLVVNQCSSAATGQRTYGILAKACASFLGRAPVLAGVVRRDERVPDAIRRQIPLLVRHPNATAADDLRRLATTLLQGPESLQPSGAAMR